MHRFQYNHPPHQSQPQFNQQNASQSMQASPHDIHLDEFFHDQSNPAPTPQYLDQSNPYQSDSTFIPQSPQITSLDLLNQHHSSDPSSSDDSSDDEYDSTTQLMPKRIRRTDASISETFQRLRKSQAAEDKYLEKLDQEQYLETQEQIELIREMTSQAQLMATIWRYLALGSTTAWATLITIFLCLVVFTDTYIAFYDAMLQQFSISHFLFTQLPLLFSAYTHIIFANQIPRFSDSTLILTVTSTFVASVIYFISLLFHDLLTIHELLIPIINMINLAIVGYAYYSIQQSHQLIVDLKHSKYRYQSI